MKVTELKAALAERGLDTKGNKAALVERLQGVLAPSDDSKANSNDKVEPPTISKEDRNGDHPEEAENGDEEEEEEEEPAVPGNEDGTTFEQQEFVRSKPAGISFGLHEPTKVKPQPRELLAPAVALGLESGAAGETNTRAGAAAFFGGGEGGAGEAAVPLPPTTSFLEESDDEEEEGPPGVGNVELPAGIFTKVRTRTNTASQRPIFDILFFRTLLFGLDGDIKSPQVVCRVVVRVLF